MKKKCPRTNQSMKNIAADTNQTNFLSDTKFLSVYIWSIILYTFLIIYVSICSPEHFSIGKVGISLFMFPIGKYWLKIFPIRKGNTYFMYIAAWPPGRKEHVGWANFQTIIVSNIFKLKVDAFSIFIVLIKTFPQPERNWEFLFPG